MAATLLFAIRVDHVTLMAAITAVGPCLAMSVVAEELVMQRGGTVNNAMRSCVPAITSSATAFTSRVVLPTTAALAARRLG